MLALALGGAPAAHAIEFESEDFDARTLVDGLYYPTAVDWTPDGRMFITETRGVLKVWEPGAPAAAVVWDEQDRVGDNSDRGLLGLAVDSSYESNNYVYLLYTRDTGLMDDDSGPMVSQLARLKINAANQVLEDTPILGTHIPASSCPEPSNTLDCIPSEGTSHSIGSVRSAPDGTLWVGSGDAAGFNFADPLALRTYNEQSFAGKIMHIDREGNGLPGHPFCPTNNNLTHVCTKLHSKGFRNPFRFQLRPDGEGLAIGDVGWGQREEVDLVALDDGGGSYGWPCYEGTIQPSGYQDFQACQDEYAKPPGTHRPPAWDYFHGPGAAAQSGPVYTGENYPLEYRDQLYVADYSQRWIKRLTLDGQDVTQEQPFATDFFGVDIEQAPNGNLVYVDLFGGAVNEITYQNTDPTAVASATPTEGAAPLQVQFNGAGSSDPDDDPIEYDWDFGDGSPHSSEVNPSHTYTGPGDYTARLTVTDPIGGNDSDTVPISAGNTSPDTPTIVAPEDDSLYRDGTTIQLQGEASDPQEGPLPGSALAWTVRLRHGDPPGDHLHPIVNNVLGATTSFEARPDHDADSHYEITLKATDSGNLSSSRTVEIFPETVDFTLASSPPGAPVSYASGVDTAPFSTESAIGFETTIGAAEQFESGGRTYRFTSWSDGGARSHNITIPDSPTTLTATYEDVTPGTITIEKQSEPGGALDEFDFSGDAPIGEFTLSDGETHTFPVDSGSYAVTELAAPGWDLTSLSCDDSDSTSAGSTATIRVAPAEDVTCIYRNTTQSSVTIEKQTDPDGDPAEFDFDGDSPIGDFALSDDGTKTVPVAPGTYSVTEAPKTSWDLTGLTCDDGSATAGPTATIEVSPAEDVTCTYRNTKRGSITIEKQTVPAGTAGPFQFTGELGGFDLGHGETRTFARPPGAYSLTEQGQGGWDLAGVTCSDGDSRPAATTTVALSAGEDVRCVFTNVRRGKITVRALTDPPQDPGETFAFTGDPPLENFELEQDETYVEEVPPGTYEVTQEPSEDYTLKRLACDDSDSTVSIADRRATVRLAAAEEVSCTFTAEPDDGGEGTAPTIALAGRRGLNRRRNRLSGSVRDPDGLRRLDVAIGRTARRRPGVSATRCRWWSKRTGRLGRKARRCARPSWMRAKLLGRGSRRRWRAPLGGRLPRGRYRLLIRVTDGERERTVIRRRL